jgi:hypothetical protein
MNGGRLANQRVKSFLADNKRFFFEFLKHRGCISDGHA